MNKTALKLGFWSAIIVAILLGRYIFKITAVRFSKIKK